jgi:hypothetical protein
MALDYLSKIHFALLSYRTTHRSGRRIMRSLSTAHRNKELVILYQRTLYYWSNKRSERRRYNWKAFYGVQDHSISNKLRTKSSSKDIKLDYVNLLM